MISALLSTVLKPIIKRCKLIASNLLRALGDLGTHCNLEFPGATTDQARGFNISGFPRRAQDVARCGEMYMDNFDIGTQYYQMEIKTSNRIYYDVLGTSGFDADMIYHGMSGSV